ncbi:MAG TPA: Uma2 family endonuclease [Acetobacteraceae bacterium]
MNIAVRKPRMTRDAFFPWAQTQEVRYEFDGFEPVAMTGGTVNHDRITVNLLAALRVRLRGSGCRPGGPNAGLATIGDAVRYPDALVSCTRTPGTAYLVADPVVVFEVLSPTSGRTDRIDKVREYAAVASIRRYVIVESTDVGVTVLERASGDAAWIATALTAEDTLRMPEIGIEVPVAEMFEDTDLSAAEAQ